MTVSAHAFLRSIASSRISPNDHSLQVCDKVEEDCVLLEIDGLSSSLNGFNHR